MYFEYDGTNFEKVNGVWFCRDWAMRGPTGEMKDREVPEKYALLIEKSYQEVHGHNQNEKVKFDKALEEANQDFANYVKELNQEVSESKPETIESKLEDLKEKVKSGKIKKAIKTKDKTSLVGRVNPFK